MKLTRKKLKQLINEALKPFFMGVPPTDIIDRLLKDDTIDNPYFPKIKELLSSPDPVNQRHALNLLQSLIPEIGKKYPELSSYSISDPVGAPDLTHRSHPVYKKEFEKAQKRATNIQKALPLKELIIKLLDDSGLRPDLEKHNLRIIMTTDDFVNALGWKHVRFDKPQVIVRVDDTAIGDAYAQLMKIKRYLDAELPKSIVTWPLRETHDMPIETPYSATPSSRTYEFHVLPHSLFTNPNASIE